jgi:hypothetical protein
MGGSLVRGSRGEGVSIEFEGMGRKELRMDATSN